MKILIEVPDHVLKFRKIEVGTMYAVVGDKRIFNSRYRATILEVDGVPLQTGGEFLLSEIEKAFVEQQQIIKNLIRRLNDRP